MSFRNYTIASFGFGDPEGIEWFGACQEFNVSNGLFQEWAGTLFDFGTATFSNGLALGPTARYRATAPKIVMEGSAANILTGALGQVSHNKFLGTAIVTSGFDENTLGFEFIGNQGIADTSTDSLSVNTAGGTLTIATVNTPVKVADVWIDQSSAQFEVDLTGRVTYKGLKDRSLPIDLSISTGPVSGTNKDFTVYVAINGTIVTASGVPAKASSGDNLVVPVAWQHDFKTDDFIEVFLENNTDAVDFVYSRALTRIN